MRTDANTIDRRPSANILAERSKNWQTHAPPTISVILPVYNERENLEALISRLIPVLEKAVGGEFEILFIDDGSRDGSAEILDSFHKRDSRLKTIHFSRNFGHQAALQAGLDEATGCAVVMMDADLQDPPELLHRFIDLWRQKCDVVYAVRKRRKEGFLMRSAYLLFYRTPESYLGDRCASGCG